MRIKHLRIGIVLIVVGMVLLPAARSAPLCDCFYYPNHLKAFREAKAIFIGEVIAELIEYLPRIGPEGCLNCSPEHSYRS
jgi:hypothetical protein